MDTEQFYSENLKYYDKLIDMLKDDLQNPTGKQKHWISALALVLHMGVFSSRISSLELKWNKDELEGKVRIDFRSDLDQ